MLIATLQQLLHMPPIVNPNFGYVPVELSPTLVAELYVYLLPQQPNLYGHDTATLQTDGQTDSHVTSDINKCISCGKKNQFGF